MGVSARQLIVASLGDLGVIGIGETPSAAVAQDALDRLNGLVSTLRTQALTVLAIERTIFPLVANKATYTIGPGGDFDVPRPQLVTGAGLLLNGLNAAVAVTSITRSGTAATVTQTAHGYTVGREVLIAGATPSAYNGLQTVESVPTSGTWTFTVDGTPTTPATGTITAASLTEQPVEIVRALLTDDGYQAIPIKTLPNSLFTTVYFNPTAAPFATIVLQPVPNTTQNQLVLYLQSVFEGFADLTTSYDWPTTPGYQEMLQYNLGVRLARPNAIPFEAIPDLIKLANSSLGLIKRQNYKLSDLPNDLALALGRSPRGGYNINSGTGGGAI